MSLFLLDTDTLTLFQHDTAIVWEAVEAARMNKDIVALTAISIEEQANGWLAAMRAAKNHPQLAQASRLFSRAVTVWGSFPTFPQTEASLATFDRLVAMKLNVGKMDLRIASIALELKATVVTHNLRDFGRVPGITVTDWTLPQTAPPTGAS